MRRSSRCRVSAGPPNSSSDPFRRIFPAAIGAWCGLQGILPTILFYTAFVYWTFRGKVRIDSGYH